MEGKALDIFLDSGAFSAYTKGISIDIDEYIGFIKKYQEKLTVYANLDVIGDPAATLRNQRIMENAGLKPLPCFHRGEPVKYLRLYLKEHDYIALGGIVSSGVTTRGLIEWLDNLWANYLCDGEGNPVVKVHGFGITSLPILKRYPWYSVDSTSWVVVSRMGQILVPAVTGGKWDYIKAPLLLTVSSKGRRQGAVGSAKTLDGLSKGVRKYVDKYIAEHGFTWGKSEFREEERKKYKLKENERWLNEKTKNGKELVEVVVEPGLCNFYHARDYLCAAYFLELQKTLPDWPWKFTKKVSTGFGLV